MSTANTDNNDASAAADKPAHTFTESEKQELIEAESMIDTLTESSPISETKAYSKFRQALDALQRELTAQGIQGHWGHERSA
jgi:hypothetical protein